MNSHFSLLKHVTIKNVDQVCVSSNVLYSLEAVREMNSKVSGSPSGNKCKLCVVKLGSKPPEVYSNKLIF